MGTHRQWVGGVLDRVVRTALQVFIGYMSAASIMGEANWAAGLSATAMAVVLSLLTSLVTGPSFGDTWYYQLAERALKSFAQSLVAWIGTATLVTEVDWRIGLSTAVLTGLYSLVTSTVTARFGPHYAEGQVDVTLPPTHPSRPQGALS